MKEIEVTDKEKQMIVETAGRLNNLEQEINNIRVQYNRFVGEQKYLLDMANSLWDSIIRKAIVEKNLNDGDNVSPLFELTGLSSLYSIDGNIIKNNGR